MPVSADPQSAPGIAEFGAADNPAAQINYDVPIPGAYSFQRIVQLEINSRWTTPEAWQAGTPASDFGLRRVDGKLDQGRLSALYQRMLPPTAQPSVRLAAEVGVGTIGPQLSDPAEGDRDGDGDGQRIGITAATAVASEPPQVLANLEAMREDGRSVLDQGSVGIQRVRREQFLDKLAWRQVNESDRSAAEPVRVPVAALGESVQTVDYNIDAWAGNTPRIAIVETWQIASFLGDYGLGKTLQTFSLLPGERTTISVETWRTDAATREDASSVFDSSDTAAQTRFSLGLMRESGSAFQDQGGWAVSVGAKAGFNVGVAQGSLEYGFAANHQEARQNFSNSAVQATREHALQANATRRQSVESASSEAIAEGVTTTTVREISNTNLRRVLNFVFRELNQTYETITSLRDVRIAFYNGNVGSGEIVPLADMRRLLNYYIDDADRRREIARWILKTVAQCIDSTGTPRTMLQVGNLSDPNAQQGTYYWQDVTLANAEGEINFADDPLSEQYSWRIKSGPIGQDGADRKVPGVVTAKESIVLRTDQVAVEALLGQADALDPYATALQALDIDSRDADIKGREAETRRTDAALELVNVLKDDDPEKAVDAFERILTEKPNIDVQPDINVSLDGTA